MQARRFELIVQPLLFVLLVGLFILLLAWYFWSPGTEPPAAATPNAGPATDDFFDAHDFVGHYTNAPVGRLGGTSVYNGRIVFSNLLRSDIEGVLPPNLKLAANVPSAKTVHPVVLLFGHQTNMTWVYPGQFPTPIPGEYGELIVIIPFVQDQTGLNWHNYVVRMFVDDVIAMVGGNTYFGYRKVLASFTDSGGGTLFMVSPAVLNASLSAFGAWFPDPQANNTLANYQHLKEIFQMPVLGTMPFPVNQHVCSYFDWNLDTARIRSITSQHAFLSAFESGMAPWVALGSIASVAQGAFEVEGLVWRLSYPAVCMF